MTAADRPVVVDGAEELVTHLRQEVSTGHMPHVLNLLEVAKDMGGEELADQIYRDIVRPGLEARWDSWAQAKPDAPDLTEDELVLLTVLVVERTTGQEVTRSEADKLRLALRRGAAA